MNHNWPRWVNTSIGKVVKSYCDLNNVFLYVEGEARNTAQRQDWVELRVNGPDFLSTTKDFWIAKLEINILILSKNNQIDNHRLLKNIGLMSTLLSSSIPVLKLGNGVDDDQSYITCIILDNREHKPLRVSQLGQVTDQTPLQRASVNGLFTVNFEG